MNRFLPLACVPLLLAAPATVHAQTVPDDLGAHITEQFITPSIARFHTATQEAANTVEALCASPNAQNLQAAHTSFAGLVRSWGAVSILRFGPIQSQNRFERIFFWPDPRGVIIRQVQAVLASKDEVALTAEGLASKSVAVQGLSALEFVLHGSDAHELLETEQSYRCRYGLAVVKGIEKTAAEIKQEWAQGSAFHADFTAPKTENQLYRSQKEVAAELVKAFGTTLQFVAGAELLPALGESAEKARGKRAPFWRSDLTFTLVGAQVEGVSNLLATARLEETDSRSAVANIQFDLTHAIDTLKMVSQPAETAFADSQDRQRIHYVTVALDTANKAVSDQLSSALGLTMGFNALDGD